MIEVQFKLPHKIYLAVSGGIDSVAVLDFLSRKHDVDILHVNHGTPQSNQFQKHVEGLSIKYACGMHVYKIVDDKPQGKSMEEWWRDERYRFFHSFDGPVVTCHHLNDCVETWIWSSLHGNSRVIPYRNQNVIRPFRTTPKREFKAWAQRNSLTWIEDQSNVDTSYTRNYIRQKLMPMCKKVNPGIEKTVKKIVKKETCHINKNTNLMLTS